MQYICASAVLSQKFLAQIHVSHVQNDTYVSECLASL